MYTVDKVGLQKALEVVKPGLAGKEMIEQSTHFAFLKGRVVTYNDEISMSHPIDGLGLDIEGAVPADKLYALLSKIKRDEIEITVNDAEMQFKAGRTRAGLALQAEVRLPLEELGEIGDWEPLPDRFLEGLGFTTWTCSNDMSRPILTCIHVSEKGVLESSDNYRITRYKLKKKLPVPSFLIPANSAKNLVRLPVSEVAWGEGWVHFRTNEGTVFSCRIFNDSFPEVEPLLAVKGTPLSLPSSMEEILERAAVFSAREHRLDEEAALALKKDKLIVSAKSDAGWIEEVARIKYDGPEVTFMVNPTFLREVISKAQFCVLGKDRMKFSTDIWDHVLSLRADMKGE